MANETCMLCKVVDFDTAKRNEIYYITENKFDGCRAVVKKDSGRVAIFNRRGLDISYRYPELLSSLNLLPDRTTLDGEIVFFTDFENQISSFNKLQSREHLENGFRIGLLAKNSPCSIVIFDILRVEGRILTALPLEERKRILQEVFFATDLDFSNKRVVLAGQLPDLGVAWERVKRFNLEGLILKRRGSPYEFRRSANWLKLKFVKEIELEAIAFETNPKGITVITREGHRVACNGHQSIAVRKEIEGKGKALIEAYYLNKTKSNRLRMPTFKRLVVVE